MSKRQKWILLVGLLLMALGALFPPMYVIGWTKEISRRFLFDSDFGGYRSIHIIHLIVEWMFIVSATGFLIVAENCLIKHRTERSNDSEHKASEPNPVDKP